MAPKKSNKPPRRSLYPCLAFYLIQAFQVLSSCVVAGVMFFFVSHLRQQNYAIPWMFFMVSRGGSTKDRVFKPVAPRPYRILIPRKLQASAILTLITILVLSLWSCFRGPIPLASSIVHGVLFIAWGVGFGLLANAMSSTLTRPCTSVYWGNSQGIQICTLYKALFAGAAVGV